MSERAVTYPVRRTGEQANRRTGEQANRRTGEQANRRTDGQSLNKQKRHRQKPMALWEGLAQQVISARQAPL